MLFRDLLELNEDLFVLQRSTRTLQEDPTNLPMTSGRKILELDIAGVEEDNGIVVYLQKRPCTRI